MPSDSNSEFADEIRDFLKLRVEAGFDSEEDIVEESIEYFADNEAENGPGAENLSSLVRRLTTELINEQLEAEKSWQHETDCDRLDRAFEKMEASGVLARQNFTCCQTCGHAEIWEEIEQLKQEQEVSGYVFYHQQDTERVVSEGTLYLAYGAVDGSDESSLKTAEDACKHLRDSGFDVDWNGTVEKRICIQGIRWQRRSRHLQHS